MTMTMSKKHLWLWATMRKGGNQKLWERTMREESYGRAGTKNYEKGQLWERTMSNYEKGPSIKTMTMSNYERGVVWVSIGRVPKTMTMSNYERGVVWVSIEQLWERSCMREDLYEFLYTHHSQRAIYITIYKT